MPNFWLMKSEPDAFGIDDLKKAHVEPWDGIRNYQVRNFFRDRMEIGDWALFYHSNATPPGVVGLMKIVSDARPDHTAFDPNEKYFDPKSDPDNPRWLLRDVEYVGTFENIIPLADLKAAPELDGMLVTKKGQRLSVQPVEPEHFYFICDMAGWQGDLPE